MVYVMLGSAAITFLLLGLAKRLPDPYWNILLHAQEASLAVFIFCTIAIFMRTFELSPNLSFRGRKLVQTGKPVGHWKPMASLLMGIAALAYRISALKAFVAWNNLAADRFDTWNHRGNVFALTLALISATIAMAHLRDDRLAKRIIAYTAATCSLVSFLPLLDPLGIPAVHPLSFVFVIGMALMLFGLAHLIQKKWGVL
jgi:hypothetical protein